MTDSRMRELERGFTLIEAFAALAILAIGMLGYAGLQVIAVRANHFGKRLAQASALARDLAENVERWDYADKRLNPFNNAVYTSTTASDIANRWDLGQAATLTSNLPQYGEVAADPNATTAGALGTGYTGISSPQNDNGTSQFYRYWTVFALDLNGTGTPQGKLVQVIVRWKEPNLGFRQTTLSTYKPNPQAAFNGN